MAHPQEGFQAVDEIGSVERISANAHTKGLSQANLRGKCNY